MRQRCLLAVTAIALSSVSTGIGAQTYPARPITLVVPWPAGGPSDRPARIVAERMRAALGQPVVVENVVGASGSTGTGRVARAAPDGYTIVHGNLSTHVLNAAVLTLPYDVQSDFQPVSLLADQPFLIVGKRALSASTLEDLIAWLKANPGKGTQGTGGPGGMPHLMGTYFQRVTGTRFGLVPYRGTAVAINDLVAGHIDIMIDAVNNTLPQSRAGLIKVYAVTAKTRLPAAPDIPSVDEAGLPGFHFSSWQAIMAPKGTPAIVIDKLNAAIVETLADPEVRRQLADLGQEIFPREQQGPDALAAFHRSELERWWPIIKAASSGSD